ncbi:MAG TPA: 4Fe-4S dicluster domain-containing protein [Thioploca sp.]|nr:4Fe-4S dicluster domain-containing protein [Thioploca sp.]
MITMTIDGKVITTKTNKTVLQVAKANNIYIPTLCAFSGLETRSVCRICSIEVKGEAFLNTACSTLVKEGMEIITNNDKVRNARKVLMAFILAEHGKSDNLVGQINKLAQELGVEKARLELTTKPDTASILPHSEYIKLTPALCIYCDRCISVCKYNIIHRAKKGATVTLTFGDNNESLDKTNCVHCGDCISVCPTGALAERV